MTDTSMVRVPQGNEVSRALTPQDVKLNDMRRFLGDNMKALTAALPAHMKPERLARIVLTTVQKNPKLLDCTRESFIGCVLSCAALGLEPDGLLGQAYLVPFRDHGKVICTLIPGYKGLLKLAYQSGEIATIDAHEVRIGDNFDFDYGTKPFLKHEPAQAPIVTDDKGIKSINRNWRPGAITHFYAVAIMRDGTTQFRVMATWEVDEIRDGSQGYQYAVKNNADNPWITDYAEMGKKTVIRAICKLLPASVEKQQLQRAVSIDERADRGLPQELDLVTDIPALPVDPEIEPGTSDGQQADDAKPSLGDVAKRSKEARQGEKPAERDAGSGG